MIGWAAVTGSLSVEPLLLFAIIFMWTPPHFWALALFRNEDYTRAGVPMMPVVAGESETRRQILIYALLLAPLAVVPSLIGMAGIGYGILSAALGINFVRRPGRSTVGRKTPLQSAFSPSLSSISSCCS